MKRVTILVEDHGVDEDGDHIFEARITTRHGSTSCSFYIRPDDVLAVEDVPDPLPTEPGVRFWGKAQDHPAEWWFTVESVRQGVDVYYIASSGMSVHDAHDVGLVRLPDPEVTP